ncbi:hypothetical protein NHX12_021759 [Muraenolepis orangiensis]|uniref:Vexin n=1 Tax=Muraenolepis orangiensis TaxID=630683 RepID=A0A9Q0EQQ5_9TELE|nr:hypothetical protein NHX12_021759 [Muraenolepis orangiensis]
MHRVYHHHHDHIEVFTTVCGPQVRYRFHGIAEKMVVAHNYKPNWPDEVALARGDVILVMSKHEEDRWFGRLQNGQRGYFPAACVMELGQRAARGEGGERGGAGAGGGGGGEGGAGPTGAPRERVGPFLVLRPQVSLAPQPTESHRSPGLLHRMLSKRWKKTEYQGATNRAFEAD